MRCINDNQGAHKDVDGDWIKHELPTTTKKYFTKYLPVKGEIKEGDIFEIEKGTYSKLISMINNTCKCLCIHGFKVGQEYTCHAVNLQKKVKLFVCSRAIVIDDKVWNPNTKQYENVVSFNPEVGCISYDSVTLDEALSSCYKVIGEISREATWVKEGDEFDKDEIYLSGHGPNWNDETPLSGKSIAFIKGPCGHRH